MNSNYSTTSSPSLPGNISSALNGLVGAGQGALGNSGWNDYQQKAMDAASFGLDQGTNNMGQASYTAHDLTGFWNPGIGASQAGLTTLGRGSVRDIDPAQAGLTTFNRGSVRDIGADQIGAQDVHAGTLPGVDLSQYMNPYIQNVVNTSMGELNRQGDIDQQRLNGNAALSGAFGGDRAAITNTEAARNLEQTKASTLGSLYSQGYNTATGLAQTDLARLLQAAGMNQQAGLQAGIANQNADLAAARSNQGADLTVGQQNASAANQLAQYNANLRQQAAAANQGMDYQVGTLNTNSANQMAEYNANLQHQAQIANQQNGLSSAALRLNAANSLGQLGYQWGAARGGRIPGIARADGGRIPRRALGGTLFREGTAMQELPLMNLAALARIYSGLPYGSLTSHTQNRPGPSMLAQGAGLGTTIAGLLGASGAFGKNGWMFQTGGSQPQQQDPWTAAGETPPVPGIKPAEFSNPDNQDLNGTLQAQDYIPDDAWSSPDAGQYAARGGRINYARGGIARFADGGDTFDPSIYADAVPEPAPPFDPYKGSRNPVPTGLPAPDAAQRSTAWGQDTDPRIEAAARKVPVDRVIRERQAAMETAKADDDARQAAIEANTYTAGGPWARSPTAQAPAPQDAAPEATAPVPGISSAQAALADAAPDQAPVTLQPGQYDPTAPLDDPNALPPYSPLIAAPRPGIKPPQAGIAAAPSAEPAGIARPMARPAGLPSVAPAQVSGVTPPSVGAPSAARPRAGIAAAPYKPDIWMPLAQAGAAMMASQSPFALSALGEGAKAGLEGYQDQRKLAATMGLKQAQMDLNERKLANQEDATAGRNKYFNDKLDVMRNKPGSAPRVQIAADGTSYTVNAQGQAVPLLDTAGNPVQGHVPNAQQTRPYAKTPVQTDQGLMLFDPNDGRLEPATANGQTLQRTSPNSTRPDGLTSAQQSLMYSRLAMAVNSNPLIKAADKKAEIQRQYNDALAAGGPRPAPQQTAAPPPGAVDYLRAHPELRGQFEQKFGPGSASRILGQ